LQPVPLSFEVTGALSADRFYLRAPGCTGDACKAIRKESWQGGEGSLWFIPQFGVYGGLAHESEQTAAATFTGSGYRMYGGLKGDVKVSRGAQLAGWFTITHTVTDEVLTAESTSSTPDQARRNQFEAGAVLQVGQADGGIQAWAGVEAMPYTVDLTRVLDGDAKIALKPVIPVSAVGGVRMLSDPLGGPWSERGRLGVGVSGEVGYRIGVTGWLTAAL
jgi:hypothetical protein